LAFKQEVQKKWAACPPLFTVFSCFCEQPEKEIKKIQNARRKKIKNLNCFNFLFVLFAFQQEFQKKWAACPPLFTDFFCFHEQPEKEVKIFLVYNLGVRE
jgi:hypothetical protein